MAITAADVKNLREMTGAGMMDCKKALTATDGDIEKAVQFLKEKGLATAQKKAGRIAAEGKVVATVSADAKTAVILEVNIETDFAANTDKFKEYIEALAAQILAGDYADLDAFLNADSAINPGSTVADTHKAKIAEIGENMTIRRFEKITTDGMIVPYIHAGGKIGVVVAAEGDTSDAAKEALANLAMQIAAMNPLYITRDEMSQEQLKQEESDTVLSALNDPFTLPKPILQGLFAKALDGVWGAEDCAAYEAEKNNKYLPNFISAEGKAQLAALAVADKETIEQNKIFAGLVAGRVAKRLKDICLLDQTYVKAEDGKQSVAAYIASVNKDLKLVKMVRFETGEGIEKKEENFAEEVAKQMQ